MDLRGVLHGMTVKSLTVTYGRRLGHQDPSLVLFVGSPYPEDPKPLPGKLNDMELVKLPYGLQLCGRTPEHWSIEAVKDYIKANLTVINAPFALRTWLVPGSMITNVVAHPGGGTLGLLPKARDPQDDNYYGLTCAHILSPYAFIRPLAPEHPDIYALIDSLTEEKLTTTAFECNDPDELVENLGRTIIWREELPEEAKTEALQFGMMDVARESTNLHVGMNLDTHFSLTKRRDGTLGITDIGIVKLTKDRVPFTSPNQMAYKRRLLKDNEKVPARSGRSMWPIGGPALTFGTSTEINEGTRFGVYGAMTTCTSSRGHGRIHGTKPILHFSTGSDGIKEVSMDAIALAPGTRSARNMPKLPEEPVPSFCTQGDSGAVVFDLDTHRVYGMVIATHGGLTVFMTIDDILENIGLEYVIA